MKRILVNLREAEECRVAVLSGGELAEYYFERTSNLPQVGNIYKGVVANVEPALQAAFVDYGASKSGFLHVAEVSGRAVGSPRKASPIQALLKRAQEVVVQVIREAIEHKGASLTTKISLPGRYLVLMPGFDKVGISRKITDLGEREKLREALADLKPPKGMGFIVRTAGVDRTRDELARDLQYLLRLWDTVSKRAKRVRAPAALYRESDLAIRVVRDIFSADVEEIVVDSGEGERQIKEFLRAVMPRYQSRVRLHSDPMPLFHFHRIEDEVEKLLLPRVPLKSGGTLVIEQTEALVAIDVNSGKFTQERSAEETVYRTNLEAAREIPRQLRLRDLGGLVVCDFIDMESDAHIRDVERVFEEDLKRDRARVRSTRMSRFGVIEVTRQKIRLGAEQASHETCPTCAGTGRVRGVESACLKAIREVCVKLAQEKVRRVQIRCGGRESAYLLNVKRKRLLELEEERKKRIEVVTDAGLAPGAFSICGLDAEGKPV